MHTSLSLDINTTTNIYFLNFNQTYSCFCLGTDKGYEIYSCNPLKRILKKQVPPNGVSFISMLNETNIVAYIKKDHSKDKKEEKKVIIYNESDDIIVGILEFKDVIRQVLLNHSSIVVTLDDHAYVYSLLKLNLQHKIDINPITRGIACISPVINSIFYLGLTNNIIGGIKIMRFRVKNRYNIINESNGNNGNLGNNTSGDITANTNNSIEHINAKNSIIMAHQSNIRFITLSQDGKFIATCSEKGTLIRIYNTDTKHLVKELRRGSDEAIINWICFNQDNSHLLCRSKKGTIHIFHTDYKEERKQNNKLLYVTSYINKYLSPLKQYMPKYIDSEWSFAQFNFQGKSTISSFSITEPNVIYVISFEGIVFKINFNDINHVTVVKQSL
jgi:WD repeat-containing protein 45